MSLEYSIYIKSTDPMNETVSEVLYLLNWQFETEQTNTKLTQYLFLEDMGFALSLLNHETVLEIGSEEIVYSSIVTFKIDKAKLHNPYKKYLIKFYLSLLTKIKSESLVLFNGEEIIFTTSDNGELTISVSSFWNSELKIMLRNYNYSETKFDLI